MLQIKKLYHYSKEKYSDIRTRAMQGVDEKVNSRSQMEDYNSHISFFLEPAPLDILGTIFKPGYNDFWFTGNEIHEYTVELKDMVIGKYRLVESPEVTDFYYNGWVIEDPEMSDEEFRRRKKLIEVKMGYVGTEMEDFIKVASPLVGRTREFYLKLPKRPNWHDKTYDDLQSKYAPTVPHVMMYPTGGIVQYSSVKAVKVGNGAVPGLESIVTARKSTKW
jgi:hypothetical protein